MKPLCLDVIFHPSDFSKGDETAFAHALRIAVAAKAELRILHAGSAADEIEWLDFPHVRPLLERWGIVPVGSSHAAVAETGLRVHKIRKTTSEPVKSILRHIEEYQPELVVLATHQRQGLSRWLHQAMAEPIARQARVMTLFVPRRVIGFISEETGAAQLRNIVIPIVHVPHPRPAIDAALLLAKTRRSPAVHFHLLYVGREEDVPEVPVPLEPGWTAQTSAWQGDVVEHILSVSEARNADLIAMTTQGHKGFLDALRGSTSERVLRAAKCPVLAIPTD